MAFLSHVLLAVLLSALFVASPLWPHIVCLRQSLLGQRGCAPTGPLGNVTLHYFAGRGRGEAIRLILNEAAIPYTETAFTKETWPAAKEEGLKSGNYMFGQVPVLFTESEKPLAQSQAILQRIARASNMDCGCDYLSHCDAVALGTEDLTKLAGQTVYDENFTDEKRVAYLTGKAQTWLGHFEKILSTNKPEQQHFFGGNHLTWVDFLVFNLLDYNIAIATEAEGLPKHNILADFPKLRAFYSNFAQRPRIAAYLASDQRPKFSLPYPPK